MSEQTISEKLGLKWDTLEQAEESQKRLREYEEQRVKRMYASTPWLVCLHDGQAIVSGDDEFNREYCRVTHSKILATGLTYEQANQFAAEYQPPRPWWKRVIGF